MNRIINVVGFLTFASALSVRAVDPAIPQIAKDFWVEPSTAALLGTAFAAYGLVQPVLGPVADAVGRIRVMIICLAVLTVASFLCAVVTSFPLLFALRVISGAACGGSFPVALAIVSGLVPLAERQVAIGRLLAATISGTLLGSAVGGVVADVIHWRSMFIGLGVISLGALILGALNLRNVPEGPPHPLDVSSVVARFRGIFRMRTARICYLAVFLEGVFLFGLFPYVALLLLAVGEDRASIAGLVIASFAVGGMVYSLSVEFLVTSFGQRRMMIGGGLLVTVGLLMVAFAPPWPVQCLAFALMGFGFYRLHASIQLFVTEIAPATPSSAVAFHTFSFFVGQGIGPIVFGLGRAYIGAPSTLVVAALMMGLIGIVSAQLLVRRRT